MLLAETGRHKLPMLSVSQAQKEVTHNEALVRIDALLHIAVEDELATPPNPADTDVGKCWLVAAAANGVWAGRSGNLAIWVGGGWRFCHGTEGMRIRFLLSDTDRIWSGGTWVSAPSIANASGGTVIDSELRSVVNALLGHLRSTGVLAS